MTYFLGIVVLISAAALLLCMKRIESMHGKLRMYEATNSRYVMYYKTLNQWMKNRNKNINAAEFFNRHQLKSVAIYGIGEMGQRLFEELKGTDIKVAYFIDKRSNDIFSSDFGIKVIGLDEIASHESVDAIVVTPIYDFNAIEDMFYDMGLETTILSLEDIVYEV